MIQGGGRKLKRRKNKISGNQTSNQEFNEDDEYQAGVRRTVNQHGDNLTNIKISYHPGGAD